ncbi:hypothetical protein HanRHA438_Chr09g0381451 [Helianthus annuus]|nr:hypothetical protein HanRHA438_Chr09g0381451 [Helianthus annuus]
MFVIFTLKSTKTCIFKSLEPFLLTYTMEPVLQRNRLQPYPESVNISSNINGLKLGRNWNRFLQKPVPPKLIQEPGPVRNRF